MMKLIRSDVRADLEKEISDLTKKLGVLEPSSKEYQLVAENVVRLCNARSYIKDRFISWDTMAVVGGNILGILLVLNHEKLDIISSKAFGLIIKGRV